MENTVTTKTSNKAKKQTPMQTLILYVPAAIKALLLKILLLLAHVCVSYVTI